MISTNFHPKGAPVNPVGPKNPAALEVDSCVGCGEVHDATPF